MHSQSSPFIISHTTTMHFDAAIMVEGYAVGIRKQGYKSLSIAVSDQEGNLVQVPFKVPYNHALMRDHAIKVFQTQHEDPRRLLAILRNARPDLFNAATAKAFAEGAPTSRAVDLADDDAVLEEARRMDGQAR